MQIIPIRVFFSKTGRVKYTSHLDTMRALTRAFARSRLPFWHTQGFNPHLYMTFALPIALGYEGLCESLDARLTEEVPFEEVSGRLNEAAPPGLRILRVAEPVMEPSVIDRADYTVILRYIEADVAEMVQKLHVFAAQPIIEVAKKTKKGESMLNIRPLFQLLETEREGDALQLKLRLAAGIVQNINPTLFLKAFYHWSGQIPDGVKITRTAIYNGQMEIFQ